MQEVFEGKKKEECNEETHGANCLGCGCNTQDLLSANEAGHYRDW